MAEVNSSLSLSADQRNEMLLSYLTKLARGLMANGATVEHVEIAVRRNAEAYGLKGLSCLISSNYVSVCFHDEAGHTYMKQLAFQDGGINLEKMRLLNDVSYRVCRDKPPESELAGYLRGTKEGGELPDLAAAVFQTMAITCICGILGGTIRDMLGTSLVAFALYWIFHLLNRLRFDDIINNAIGMFIATVLAFWLADLGVAEHVTWVLISESLLMIPGIPLVNAFRNLICGNEWNGLVQLLRVGLESASLAAGTYAGVLLMGGAQAW